MNYIDIPEDGNPTFTDPITLRTYGCCVCQNHANPEYKLLQILGYDESIPNGFMWPYYFIGLYSRDMICAYLNANNIQFIDDKVFFDPYIYVSDLSKVINCINSVLNKIYSPSTSSFHLHAMRWDYEPRYRVFDDNSKIHLHFED